MQTSLMTGRWSVNIPENVCYIHPAPFWDSYLCLKSASGLVCMPLTIMSLMSSTVGLIVVDSS